MSTKNILVTITGPSVTGKSKLANLLMPEGFEELVSTTTRAPREGEINGVHYNFVSPENFEAMLTKKLMIEKVNVGKYSYGLSRPALDIVISKGKNGVAVVEPNGAQQIGKFCKENNIELHQVFINNDLDLLRERLLERFRNDRLASAKDYVSRLDNMTKVEPFEWVAPAYDGRHHYDQVFDNFTPDNEKDVVASIVQAVNLKLVQKNSSKRKIS